MVARVRVVQRKLMYVVMLIAAELHVHLSLELELVTRKLVVLRIVCCKIDLIAHYISVHRLQALCILHV